MSQFTQALQDLEITLANPQEMCEDDYMAAADELQYFHEEHGDEFTDDDFDIYNRADLLIEVGEVYFEGIYRAEEAECRRDEQRYLSSECNH